MPSSCLMIDGKKFMWNGVEFSSKEAILDAMQKYKKDGFEVETYQEGDKLFLYTRRVVKQVAVTNPSN